MTILHFILKLILIEIVGLYPLCPLPKLMQIPAYSVAYSVPEPAIEYPYKVPSERFIGSHHSSYIYLDLLYATTHAFCALLIKPGFVSAIHNSTAHCLAALSMPKYTLSRQSDSSPKIHSIKLNSTTYT